MEFHTSNTYQRIDRYLVHKSTNNFDTTFFGQNQRFTEKMSVNKMECHRMECLEILSISKMHIHKSEASVQLPG